MHDPPLRENSFDQLEFQRRPLRDSEKRALRGKLGSLRRQGRRAVRASRWIGLGIFVVLWIVTLFASDVSWVMITGFWFVVGMVITLWARRDLVREVGHASTMARRLESAVKHDEAAVYDIRAEAFVEFEEVEDEGACFAFDLGGGRIAFVSGQEFYPAAGFPSLDFSLVYILDEHGQAVDMFIDKRGPVAEPTRTIPAATKWTLDIPESLSVMDGALDELEEILGRSG
jgi:hypothetical protein